LTPRRQGVKYGALPVSFFQQGFNTGHASAGPTDDIRLSKSIRASHLQLSTIAPMTLMVVRDEAQ
jgi:hypothetical protein